MWKLNLTSHLESNCLFLSISIQKQFIHIFLCVHMFFINVWRNSGWLDFKSSLHLKVWSPSLNLAFAFVVVFQRCLITAWWSSWSNWNIRKFTSTCPPSKMKLYNIQLFTSWPTNLVSKHNIHYKNKLM
jgi:hypothetical protein